MLDNSVLFDYNLVRIFKKYSKFVISLVFLVLFPAIKILLFYSL